MAKWGYKEIQEAAISELEATASNGIRYMELARRIHAAAPETPVNSIGGALVALASSNPNIVKPSRGVWLLKKFTTDESGKDEEAGRRLVNNATITDEAAARMSEELFYAPFMQWLLGEELVIEAMVVGGSAFRSKWATPDVIGTYKSRKSDLVQFPIELVSAEIKTDGNQSITAFGQACAYRLFSHKTFIVMPQSMPKNDLERLESLCSLYGMGLVLFELDPETPNFQMRLHPQRFEPDMFYVNDFARRLLEMNQKEFNRLFG